MNLSISNIAWDTSFEREVLVILKENNINIIDFAPTKFFSNISSVSDKEINDVKNLWKRKGFIFGGMQSLLFGTQGLNLFNKESQNNMLAYLKKICHIGAITNASRLVFGSPKNRDRSKLNDEQTENISLDFFYKLGEIAKYENVIICIEPNPKSYGTNFITTTEEAALFVKKLNHPNIKIQLDLGTIYTNKEPEEVLEKFIQFVGHVHLSEPNLIPLTNIDFIHKKYGNKLKEVNSKGLIPTDIFTIEMLTSADSSNKERIKSIKSSIFAAKQLYIEE